MAHDGKFHPVFFLELFEQIGPGRFQVVFKGTALVLGLLQLVQGIGNNAAQVLQGVVGPLGGPAGQLLRYRREFLPAGRQEQRRADRQRQQRTLFHDTHLQRSRYLLFCVGQSL